MFWWFLPIWLISGIQSISIRCPKSPKTLCFSTFFFVFSHSKNLVILSSYSGRPFFSHSKFGVSSFGTPHVILSSSPALYIYIYILYSIQIYIYNHIHKCIYVYIYMYIYIHTHTGICYRKWLSLGWHGLGMQTLYPYHLLTGLCTFAFGKSWSSCHQTVHQKEKYQYFLN